MSVPAWALTANPRVSVTISRKTIRQLQNYIKMNNENKLKVRFGTDMLVRAMILMTRAAAQEESMGPIAPNKRSVPALAFKIPVQRITGRYFAGWRQKRLGNGHWMVYNDAKEAYLVEYGIYQRVRRPILKLAALDMLRFMATTRTAYKFQKSIMAPNRNAKGQFAGGFSFSNSFLLGLSTEPGSGRGMNNPNLAGPHGKLPG